MRCATSSGWWLVAVVPFSHWLLYELALSQHPWLPLLQQLLASIQQPDRKWMLTSFFFSRVCVPCIAVWGYPPSSFCCFFFLFWSSVTSRPVISTYLAPPAHFVSDGAVSYLNELWLTAAWPSLERRIRPGLAPTTPRCRSSLLFPSPTLIKLSVEDGAQSLNFTSSPLSSLRCFQPEFLPLCQLIPPSNPYWGPMHLM